MDGEGHIVIQVSKVYRNSKEFLRLHKGEKTGE